MQTTHDKAAQRQRVLLEHLKGGQALAGEHLEVRGRRLECGAAIRDMHAHTVCRAAVSSQQEASPCPHCLPPAGASAVAARGAESQRPAPPLPLTPRHSAPPALPAPPQRFATSASDPSGYERRASTMDDVVIVSACRTALCKAKRGGFKDTPVDDLIAAVLKDTLRRTGVEPEVRCAVAAGGFLGGAGVLGRRQGRVHGV